MSTPMTMRNFSHMGSAGFLGGVGPSFTTPSHQAFFAGGRQSAAKHTPAKTILDDINDCSVDSIDLSAPSIDLDSPVSKSPVSRRASPMTTKKSPRRSPVSRRSPRRSPMRVASPLVTLMSTPKEVKQSRALVDGLKEETAALKSQIEGMEIVQKNLQQSLDDANDNVKREKQIAAAKIGLLQANHQQAIVELKASASERENAMRRDFHEWKSGALSIKDELVARCEELEGSVREQELQHETALSQMESNHAQEVDALITDRDATVQELGQKVRKITEELKASQAAHQQCQAQIEKLQAQQTSSLKALEVTHAEAIKAMASDNKEQMDGAQKVSEKQLSELSAKLESERVTAQNAQDKLRKDSTSRITALEAQVVELTEQIEVVRSTNGMLQKDKQRLAQECAEREASLQAQQMAHDKLHEGQLFDMTAQLSNIQEQYFCSLALAIKLNLNAAGVEYDKAACSTWLHEQACDQQISPNDWPRWICRTLRAQRS